MRISFLPVVCLVASTVTFWYCSFDDERRLSNQFIVDGKSYALASGVTTVHEETPAEGGLVQVWSVTIDSPGKARKIHSVSFDLYTGAADVLPEGNYTFDTDQQKGADTFHRVNVTVNYDRQRQEGGQVYKDLEGGTVAVRLMDEARQEYAISFDLVVDQRTVKGYYRGVINIDR
jgi:hypothetical protein